MRIIKPVLEDNISADIAENAARAPYFLVFDNDKFIKSIKNPFTTWGGAGFAVADLLNNEWCNKFIAKKLGDNMKSALDNHGILYEIID